MGFFECCRYCKAPKRYPGCHSECPEYIERKKLWEEYKEAEKLSKSVEFGASPAQMSAVRNIQRKQRQNRKQY